MGQCGKLALVPDADRVGALAILDHPTAHAGSDNAANSSVVRLSKALCYRSRLQLARQGSTVYAASAKLKNQFRFSRSARSGPFPLSEEL